MDDGWADLSLLFNKIHYLATNFIYIYIILIIFTIIFPPLNIILEVTKMSFTQRIQEPPPILGLVICL